MISDILLRRLHIDKTCVATPEKTYLKDRFGPALSFKRNQVIATNVPTVEQCLNGLQWSPAENELAVFILLRGGTYEYYNPGLGDVISNLILLDKHGIDWAASAPPSAGTWTSFDGTFAEDSDRTVLELKFSTLDRHWQKYSWDTLRFGIEMPDLADIIKACSGFFLKQLEQE